MYRQWHVLYMSTLEGKRLMPQKLPCDDMPVICAWWADLQTEKDNCRSEYSTAQQCKERSLCTLPLHRATLGNVAQATVTAAGQTEKKQTDYEHRETPECYVLHRMRIIKLWFV